MAQVPVRGGLTFSEASGRPGMDHEQQARGGVGREEAEGGGEGGGQLLHALLAMGGPYPLNWSTTQGAWQRQMARCMCF